MRNKLKEQLISSWWKFSVLIIALLSAWITLAQAMRVTTLLDYSYQADAAYRIYLGEMPYRDFFLVVNPGIYLIMAAIIALAGNYNHLAQVVGTMTESILIVLTTFMAILGLTNKKILSIIIIIPLLFAGHSIYPYPIYDISATLMIVFALVLLIAFERDGNKAFILGLLSGLSAGFVFIIKQNIGGVFVPVLSLTVFFTSLLTNKKRYWLFFVSLVAGVVLSVGLMIIWLLINGAWNDYLYQAFQFPSRIRDPLLGLYRQRDEYLRFFYYAESTLSKTLITGFLIFILTTCGFVMQRKAPIKKQFWWLIYNVFLIIGFFCIAGYFWNQWTVVTTRPWLESLINTGIWTVLTIFALSVFSIELVISIIKRRATTLTFLPAILIVVIHSFTVSQQLWGSSYGMWPLYLLLLAWVIIWFLERIPIIPWESYLVLFILFLTSYLAWKVYRDTRIALYTDLSGPSYQSKYPKITGMTTPGIWIPEMERLASFVEHKIPLNEPFVFLPGEDPIYIMTDRRNPLKYNQYIPETCDLNGADIAREIDKKQIPWVIIKTKQQFLFGFVLLPSFYDELSKTYTKSTVVGIYEIYKRN